MSADIRNWETLEALHKTLGAAIAARDNPQAAQTVRALASSLDAELFQELGRITRDLHQEIKAIAVDPLLRRLAEDDIPDARTRLQYVIQMTEQAANQTMNIVDALLPGTEKLDQSARELAARWSDLRARNMDLPGFQDFAADSEAFLQHCQADAANTRKALNDIFMAQEFQDLTGQIIKRVIDLVGQVEGQMVALVREFASAGLAQEQKSDPAAGDALAGPAVPGLSGQETVSSQDEVDDLLSSLGF